MNILLIRFTALGDLVTREPTFRAIKHFFPTANITFLTSSIGKGLYQDSGYFDHIHVHQKYIDTVKELRKKEFDIIINLQCTKFSHYITMLLQTKVLINKSYSLLQKIFKLKAKTKSLQELLLKAGVEQIAIDNYFNNMDNIHIHLPHKQLLNQDKDISVAICTGSSKRWESKKWGIDNYTSLIEQLIHNKIKIILVGSALEREDAKVIMKKFPQIQNLVDKTNLSSLKSVLSSVSLFIGNDSGPTHIAAGVGTPTLTIFGPTSIKHSPKFDKYPGEHFFIKPSDTILCHPCYKNSCPTKHECMANIKVAQVFDIIDNFFKDKK